MSSSRTSNVWSNKPNNGRARTKEWVNTLGEQDPNRYTMPLPPRRVSRAPMQRVYQSRAGNVSEKALISKSSWSVFNRAKRAIISKAEMNKAAWNGHFQRKRETLNKQSIEKQKKLNAKKVTDIQKAWEAAKAKNSRQASFAQMAFDWNAHGWKSQGWTWK